MFLNAMYGGLGQSLGAIIGGKMQSKFGTVKTFVYSGIFFRDPRPIGEEETSKRMRRR